jgi:hypothetical protein
MGVSQREPSRPGHRQVIKSAVRGQRSETRDRLRRCRSGVATTMTDIHAAGWYADPTERHGLRFFDGTGWADAVRDGVVESSDPLPTDAAAFLPSPRGDVIASPDRGTGGLEGSGSIVSDGPEEAWVGAEVDRPDGPAGDAGDGLMSPSEPEGVTESESVLDSTSERARRGSRVMVAVGLTVLAVMLVAVLFLSHHHSTPAAPRGDLAPADNPTADQIGQCTANVSAWVAYVVDNINNGGVDSLAQTIGTLSPLFDWISNEAPTVSVDEYQRGVAAAVATMRGAVASQCTQWVSSGVDTSIVSAP